MSHYYTCDGLPRHFMPTKRGAKNPTRPTTIKDAKKEGLLPSVTGICDVLSKDALTRWIAQEAVKVAFDSPAFHYEDPDAYAKRIMSLSEEKKEAAGIGDGIHKALEAYYMGGIVPTELPLYDGIKHSTMDVIGPAIALLEKEGITVERSEFVAVSNRGYAGTVDMLCLKDGRKMVGDFKSKKTKAGKPVIPNESHPMQIAAYRECCCDTAESFGDMQAGFNLYISTTEVGRCEMVYYTATELDKAFKAFMACLTIWKYRNNYDPELA